MGSKSAIGIGNGICFKQVRDKGGGSYIDPLVRDSIVGLWKFDQNTNESPTRNIIKNTIKGKGGDLELLNFAYKANSGYNGYQEDFTSWDSDGVVKEKTSYTFLGKSPAGYDLLVVYMANSSAVESFKVEAKISGRLLYRYYVNDDDSISVAYYELKEGINTLPYSVDSTLIGGRTGFVAKDFASFEIAQLPLHEGALVTDGKDDMIVSQKTVQEMGIADEITVVSMIHQININSTYNKAFNNYLEVIDGSAYVRNAVVNDGKTGIYGYTSKLSTNVSSVINNILGDKKDYLSSSTNISNSLSNTKFSVTGKISKLNEISSVACYWTFIANKVLTTDEINQIIGYFKLDKYATPQVIYDVKRQGLTNDTPAADWYLKDFSGNGHDMQLYNYAKSKNSGIGKYAEDFTTWNKYKNVIVTKDKISVNSLYKSDWLIYKQSTTRIAPTKVKIIGIPANGRISYRHMKSSSDTVPSVYDITEDGIHDLPESLALSGGSVGFMLTDNLDWTHIEITQIPDYEGALVSDGKDDYGQFVGDLGLKDYTIAVDRAYVEGLGSQVPIISSIGTTVNTPFLMEHMGVEKILAPHSFGTYTALSTLNTDRFISYQSTYKYNSDNLTKGTSTDTGSGLTIGRFGAKNSQYAKLALWSFLLFPYSLSEFLLERQLKKYKLGTLYPNMVEWRPIYSSNVNEYTVTKTTISNKTDQTDLTIGKHYPIGSQIRFYVKPNGISDEVTSIKVNGVEFTFDYIDSTYGYAFNGTLSDKSPQKIDITIDEYIRFENIIQPYPEIWTITQNGNKVSWGDKLKVGSEFGYNSKVNLLSGLYSTANSYYNGKVVKTGDVLKVEKQMTFACNKRWKLNTTEPHAIYSPQKLNIPNSSLKILGYVPDLTGKGNHGKLNNFAYTKDSGVAADGSIKFDGRDDYITIPTLTHGGKCMMMKVNWNRDGLMLYDQRNDNNPNAFAIYIPIFNNGDFIAYSSRNDGKTYIDGVLNTLVKGSQLKDVTHNITITNSNSNNDNTVSPAIGSNAKYNTFYAQMSLYEFMLFPEIPSEDEIKKLNDVMGIEGGYVESPNYYWDSFGKANRASADIDYKDLNSAGDDINN